MHEHLYDIYPIVRVMLRHIEIKKRWRSLGEDFWPNDFPAGKKTVIYGHNGSGKSTFSELLLQLSEGASPTEITWEDSQNHKVNILARGSLPSIGMSVYTNKWVRKNLAEFLDGETASSIVTLGSEAISSKEEEKFLEEEIKRIENEIDDANKKVESDKQAIEKIVRDVQSKIVAQLKVFKPDYYTNHRYKSPKIKLLLQEYSTKKPNDDEYAESIKRLGEGPLPPLKFIVERSESLTKSLVNLSSLLEKTPTRIAIEELELKPAAQSWVEQGLYLHEESERCYFCDGELTDNRREELARHFDESWLRIRSEATTLLTEVLREKSNLETWFQAVPPNPKIATHLQSKYQDAWQILKADVDKRLTTIDAVIAVLQSKANDPSCTPGEPEWLSLSAVFSIGSLNKLIDEHNDQAQRHTEIADSHAKIILDYILGSSHEDFLQLEDSSKIINNFLDDQNEKLEEKKSRLEVVRQEKFSTKVMADTLTEDLSRVYGKNHLSVQVSDDGKSYLCRRGNQPGKDLSEGEKTTLSLLYFLRSLEDLEQYSDVEKSQRIVVIDDPSSSLDREALYATHQWLVDTLKDYGQYIILTHDFNLLRLFTKSQNNAWGKSVKAISEGKTQEINFPKVTFLELFATNNEGTRNSKLLKMTDVLRKTPSEYAYLFRMVMVGLEDSADHERLFLLPNATRRILEVFASYSCPHLPNFQQALNEMVRETENGVYRDVYDFCNQYSHGEGYEMVNVLDAHMVHRQIGRCMSFLKAVDPVHFERMCQLTGTNSARVN